MHASETTLSDARLSTLRKSIPAWIMNLQGTGNLELNQVVNELHHLNQQVSRSAGDDQTIRQQVTSLYRQVQAIKAHHKEPYRARLNDLEVELARLRA